ncbi:hypothetical protein NUW54_g3206 [Trametes sanguinea]|uniref:Uncharacterized protein n=1 Tax=Trametes sanguinea TaxID=158606 RepID=A0ACC1Q3Z6_9APHY|nr:hypothetical protein NUW54_g3206 [Trametes sanguinea]
MTPRMHLPLLASRHAATDARTLVPLPIHPFARLPMPRVSVSFCPATAPSPHHRTIDHHPSSPAPELLHY